MVVEKEEGDAIDYISEDVQRLVSTRKNQAVFRRLILSSYNNTCCMTGIQTTALLVASHIIPWSENVTEKFKLGTVFPSNQLVPKTTDMVVIITDENFKINDVKVLPKDKSNYSYSDYLFNQYLNGKKDIVFYYRDYQKDENKDKNWNLFINTIIKGKFNQEKIQISSKQDKYMIFPYPAKDGYILFFEYNKKDKYNQIRLEKLNY